MKGKYLIILQAGTEGHEGMARAVHALLYTRELKEKGYEVSLIFDGAGTEWAKALQKSENILYPHYQALKDLRITETVCDYCSGAFGVKQEIEACALPLAAEYQGHPSLVKWIEEGYTPVVL